MIVTLTPNPSIDRAVTVEALYRGQVLRASSSRIDPGGKGVNVGRALASMGGDPLVVVPSGGPEGTLFEALLRETAVQTRIVPIAGSVRMNISVLEPDGTTTKLNEAGPQLGTADTHALFAATLAPVSAGTWIAGCGSLPPGAPTDLYAQLVTEAKRLGAHVAIDSSGPAFAAAVAAIPTLIKPNREELEELSGRSLTTLGEVIDTAQELVDAGIRYVAVSLGRDGAVLVSAESVVHARSVVTDPVSTVGAGDCMLAGLLHGLSQQVNPANALIRGVSWGAAAVRLPGTEVPSPTDLDHIRTDVIHTPQRDLPVTD
ncbi:1-phosphofructokinase [Mycetocola tolaasinivorans]|uniref:1-phosphofructokinase n=1 Tax=Mycetocola tolaasinivorans TaxID=76635 RepID=A0A3L7A6M0_9MICO|nr:1-phosphofructokinase [Mycetocola tolaasinivorans]RLP75976.1 1-phosphofructokinase [Mycetocola tolaasinivorans]